MTIQLLSINGASLLFQYTWPEGSLYPDSLVSLRDWANNNNCTWRELTRSDYYSRENGVLCNVTFAMAFPDGETFARARTAFESHPDRLVRNDSVASVKPTKRKTAQ